MLLHNCTCTVSYQNCTVRAGIHFHKFVGQPVAADSDNRKKRQQNKIPHLHLCLHTYFVVYNLSFGAFYNTDKGSQQLYCHHFACCSVDVSSKKRCSSSGIYPIARVGYFYCSCSISLQLVYDIRSARAVNCIFGHSNYKERPSSLKQKSIGELSDIKNCQ